LELIDGVHDQVSDPIVTGDAGEDLYGCLV